MRHDSFKDFVLDQLGEMPELTWKAMFGGYGLYQRTTFFGIIHKGRLYFKTNDVTQALYRARGMHPFRPNAKHTLAQYYEVPTDILEEPYHLIGLGPQRRDITDRAVTPPLHRHAAGLPPSRSDLGKRKPATLAVS